MNEKDELLALLLSLTREELAAVISRAERELGLRLYEEPVHPHQTKI